MNIFFLDKVPKVAAQYHANRHVVKMILESATLLAHAHVEAGTDISLLPRVVGKGYKNHPCAKWARSSLSNYVWLANLGYELCKEYTYRYDKVHSYEPVLKWYLDNLPNIVDNGFERPYLAMPDECGLDCAVESYRNYYNMKKRHLFAWKRRERPEWVTK